MDRLGMALAFLIWMAACADDSLDEEALPVRTPTWEVITPTPRGAPTTPTLTEGPLSLDEIKDADPGTVTWDIYQHPSTSHARFVEAVNDAPVGDIPAGLLAPLGLTDKNLILYGLRSCENESPSLPRRWEPAPGETWRDVRQFARVAREQAAQHLC